MICKKSIFSTFCLFFICIAQINAQSRDLDSVYLIKTTPYLSKIIEFKDLSTIMVQSEEARLIPTKGTIYYSDKQQIIKEKDKIYVSILNSGIIFQFFGIQDSFYIFKRLDNTININYNIGCYTFLHKGNIYNYGGYGFWKSTGQVRKFSFLEMEWDIVPVSEEICAAAYQWYSKKEERLYVPYQFKLNAGIKGGGDLPESQKFQSYYLDLNAKKWVKLGTVDSKARNIFENEKGAEGFLHMNNGVLHVISDEAYFFDFIENKIYKSKKADFNQFCIRRNNMQNTFYYKGLIYSYNFNTQNYSTIPFQMNDFELLNFPIWGRDTSYDLLIVTVVFIVALVFFIIWLFNNRIKSKIEHTQLKILKTKSVNQAFVGTEISLIELLLLAAKRNEKVEINQINHVLGIKDKNIGLQKKVRSDVMNSINDKYQFITQQDIPLIGSVRKEDDKRFFEYFISPSEVKSITRILEKND
jgi:hypothetical protein